MVDLLTKFIDSLSFSEFEHLQDLRLQKMQEICARTIEELKVLFPDNEVRSTDKGIHIQVCFKNSVTKDALLIMNQLQDLTYFHSLDFNMSVLYNIHRHVEPYGFIGSMMVLSFSPNKKSTKKVDTSYYMKMKREGRRMMRTCYWKDEY